MIPSVVSVTPGYFEAMATRLVRGRYFAEAIAPTRCASRSWTSGWPHGSGPIEDPIGKGVYRGDAGPYTIVGVVREVRFEGLAEHARVNRHGVLSAHAGAAAPAAAMDRGQDGRRRRRRSRARCAGALATIDPDLPLSDIQTMEERTSRSLVSQRLAMGLASLFGLVALFLSICGIYGVLAYVVARRTREIGIRMALGSTVRGIFHLVFREGLALIVVGLILGLAGAVALGRSLQGQLFGVQPTDPFILVTVALVTGCVALLACVAPSLRATRVDPVEVLTE